ncbi:hypothetical protein FSP39_023578 [Pinctada imbricata]|uniref:Uncharacterized protein n=1 Tax=Pinctada imbricata TaxID=66713 RepID=A0AA89C027_PINIB|nr:hypothetical protein FSP39_023578 [Pinctada imbricata]
MVDLNTDFTLVIHSSSVIYGEEVDHGRFPLLKHAPADALTLLAKQLCIAAKDSGNEDLKKKRTMAQPNNDIDDVFTYTLNWWGQIHVIENNSDRSVIYIRDYSDSELLLNSRGKHRTEDVIPTGKCQVVNVMTAQMPDADWQVIPKKHLRIATTESQKLHEPEVTENFEGLHGTRPILILQPPQT